MPRKPNPKYEKRYKTYEEAEKRLPELKDRIRKNIHAKMKKDGSAIRRRSVEADFPPKYVDSLLDATRPITLRSLLVLSIIFGTAPENLLKKPKEGRRGL